MYVIKLLDKNGQDITSIKIAQVRYRFQFNMANPINFIVPNPSDNLKYLTVSREFILYKNREPIRRGKIISRDLSKEPYYFEALTSEIELETFITPNKWGAVYQGRDIGYAVRDLTKKFNIFTVNTLEDYTNYRVDQSNVNLDFEPNHIYLAYDEVIEHDIPVRTFKESGHITFQFDLGDHIGLERIRWSQTIGDVVNVAVAFRVSNNGTVWEDWYPAVENQIDSEGLGLDLSLFNLTHRYIQVRINLSTRDTETKHYDTWSDAIDAGEQIIGSSPGFMGLEVITRSESKITVHSDTPEIFGITLNNVNISNEKSLNALVTLAEDYGIEFYIDDELRLKVAPEPESPILFDEEIHLGSDKTDIILRTKYDTNIDILEDDDSELVNVLYCKGAGSGTSQITLPSPLINEDSIEEYGKREGTYIDSDITSRAELLVAGTKELEKVSVPKQTFSVSTIDKYDLKIGDLIRVANPKNYFIVDARILDIEHRGNDVIIGLNTKLRNILDRVVDTERKVPKRDTTVPIVDKVSQLTAKGKLGEVNLSWLGDADYFIIEFSTDNEKWNVLERNWRSRRYTHTGLNKGTRYYYRVAKVLNNVIGEFSKSVSTIALDNDPPNSPTVISAKGVINAIEVFLDMELDVEGYEIHMSTKDGFIPNESTWKASGKQSYFNIPVDPEIKYYIKAIAYNSSGIKSEPSNQVDAEAVPGVTYDPVNAPTWGECSFIRDIYLSWYPVNGAVSYEIRENLNWGQDTGLVFKGNSTNHRFTPTKRDYTFYIKSINGANVYSETYAEISLDLDAPNSPIQPNVSEYFSSIKISTEPSNNPAVLGYNVYIRNQGEVEELKVPIADGGTYIHTVESGTTVTIQVSAYDVLGEGAKTEPLQATTTALQDRDIPDDIITPSKLTEDLRDDIDLAKTSAGSALVQVVDLDDEVANAKQRLLATETELEDLDEIVTTHDTKITNIEGELSSKVSQTDYNLLAGTVSDHETTLTQHADQIQAKAEKSEVDTIEDRVSTAEGLLEILPGQISAKADASIVDEQGTRITTAEQQISALDGAITQTVARIDQSAILKPSGGKLWHFDNDLNSTDGIKPLEGVVATLRSNEGRFGGAVAVEEGTTNRVINSDFSSWVNNNTALSNWESFSDVEISPTEHGVKVKFFIGGNRSTNRLRQLNVNVPGSTMTISYKARKLGGNGLLSCAIDGKAGGLALFPSDVPIGEWAVVTETVDLPPSASHIFNFHASIDACEFEIDWVQVEKKPFATSFTEGTRPDGQLPIFTDAEFRGIFEDKSWTISGYFKRNKEDTGTDAYRLFSCTQSSGFNIESLATTPLRFIAYDKDIGYRFIYFSDPYIFNDLRYHHIAVCYDSESKIAKLFVDGQLDGTATFSNGIYFRDEYQYTLCVGTEWEPQRSGNNRYNTSPLNGLVDELLILPYAATEEEIQEWYEMDRPFYAEGEIPYQASRMTQLGNQWTVQLESGEYKTGIGLAVEDNISEFAVVADKFSVATPTGTKNVFTVTDGKAYLIGDLIAEGSILAEHIEADAIKTLLLESELAIIDDADILQLDAQRIFVGDNIELGDNRIVVKGNPLQQQIINITEDTYTSSVEGESDGNYSSSTNLELIHDASWNRRNTWIKIPLPTSLQSVVSVKLRLYVRGSYLADMSTISISSPTQSWDYKQITWDNEPTTFNKTRNVTFEVVNEGWLEFDITDFAREWLSGDLPNNGLRLSYVDVTDLKEIWFHSSRSSNQSLRPHIVIEGTFSNSDLYTKAALGDLGGLPWLDGVIPQGEYGSYARDAYLTGSLQVEHEGQPILAVSKDEEGGRIGFYDAEGDSTVEIKASMYESDLVWGGTSSLMKYASLEMGIHESERPLIELIAGRNVNNDMKLAYIAINDGAGIGHAELSNHRLFFDSGRSHTSLGAGTLELLYSGDPVIHSGGWFTDFHKPTTFYDTVTFNGAVNGIKVPIITGSYIGDWENDRLIVPNGLGNRKIIELTIQGTPNGFRGLLYLGSEGYDYDDRIVAKILEDGSGFTVSRYPFNSSEYMYYYIAFVL